MAWPTFGAERRAIPSLGGHSVQLAFLKGHSHEEVIETWSPLEVQPLTSSGHWGKHGQTFDLYWGPWSFLFNSIHFYSLAIKQHDIHWYTIIHNLIPLITTIDMHQLPILLWKHLARKFATILSYLFRCVPSEVPSSFWRLWKCHSGIRSNRFGHHQQEYPLQTSPQWWNSHPSAFRWKRCDPPRYLLSQHRTNCWQRPRQWSSQPSLVQSQVIIKPCHFLVYVYVVCECVCV